MPHYQPEDATFHVVFRLAGSLRAEAVEKLKWERDRFLHELDNIGDRGHARDQRKAFEQKYLERYEELLDGCSTGPTWLNEPAVAGIVKEAILHRDPREYDLIAYSIMPNHVHLIVTVGRVADPTSADSNSPQGLQGRDGVPSYGLTSILASLKKYTALRANRTLNRSGAFWQDESYDHVIRDENELKRTIWYVLHNPVQAGLVQSWQLWPWSYCKWSSR